MAKMVANAPAGIENPEEFVNNIYSLNDKWLSIIEENFDAPLTERDPDSIRESYAKATDTDIAALWDAVKKNGFDSYRNE